MTTPARTPPFAYRGGKTRLATRIAAALPRHQHYVEPFGGSLAVLLAKPVSVMETVNDIDERLITFWRVLRERPEELARLCALTPHSRAEHQQAWDADLTVLNELEVARLVWIQISQSRGGTLRRTGWRMYVDPAGSSTSMPGYLDGYTERMAAAAERLHRVSLECRPALDVIAQYGAHRSCCLYVDPRIWVPAVLPAGPGIAMSSSPTLSTSSCWRRWWRVGRLWSSPATRRHFTTRRWAGGRAWRYRQKLGRAAPGRRAARCCGPTGRLPNNSVSTMRWGFGRCVQP